MRFSTLPTFACLAALAAPAAAFPVLYHGMECDLAAPTVDFSTRTTLVNRTTVVTYHLTSAYELSCEDGESRSRVFEQQLETGTWGDRSKPAPWYYIGLPVPSTITYDLARRSFRLFTPGDPKLRTSNVTRWVADPYIREFDNADINPLEVWTNESVYPIREARFSEYNSGRFHVREYEARRAWSKSGTGDAVTTTPHALARVWSKEFPVYSAKIYCFPGNGGDDLFNRPLLVGDAFDPGSARGPYKLATSSQYANLLSTTHPSAPRTRGHDIFFVDFSQGGGDILINASLLTRTLEWLSARTSGKILVGGPSMSGIVSRLALLYALPANNSQRRELAGKVSGYISIDSPHQGASISSSLQAAVHSIKNDFTVNFLVGVTEVLSVTPWVESQTNSTIAGWRDLSVPAAHQMLYEHYYPGSDDHRSNIWRQFYDFVERKGGLRKDIPSVAIATSNFAAPNGVGYQDVDNWTVGILNPPTAYRTLRLSGTANMRRHELAPGSTGNWFFSPFSRSPESFMSLFVSTRTTCTDLFASFVGTPQERYDYFTCDPGTLCHWEFKQKCQNPPTDWEVFKGTFIPIYSALGLSGYSDISEVNAGNMHRHTRFHKAIILEDEFNGYCNEARACKKLDQCAGGGCSRKADDRRYEHIVFDSQVMEAIDQGLRYIAGRRALPIVLSTLLQD